MLFCFLHNHGGVCTVVRLFAGLYESTYLIVVFLVLLQLLVGEGRCFGRCGLDAFVLSLLGSCPVYLVSGCSRRLLPRNLHGFFLCGQFHAGHLARQNHQRFGHGQSGTGRRFDGYFRDARIFCLQDAILGGGNHLGVGRLGGLRVEQIHIHRLFRCPVVVHHYVIVGGALCQGVLVVKVSVLVAEQTLHVQALIHYIEGQRVFPFGKIGIRVFLLFRLIEIHGNIAKSGFAAEDANPSGLPLILQK